MLTTRQFLGLTALASLGAAIAPAAAHHSFAMYDQEKAVLVDGTITEYKWANPHVIVRVTGTASSGSSINGEQLWTLELPSPSQLSRNGWTPTSLKTGEKVKAEFHPFKSGQLGGAFMSVTTADGKKVDR
jgi:hypothetical protein